MRKSGAMKVIDYKVIGQARRGNVLQVGFRGSRVGCWSEVALILK